MVKLRVNSLFLLYDSDGSIHRLDRGSDRILRWASWSLDDETAILVGDNGLILFFDGRSFRRIRSGVTENLRGVSHGSNGLPSLLVGNRGTILTIDERESVRGLSLDTGHNLRRVSWSPDGEFAVIIGNDGDAFTWDGSSFHEIPGALNNLRSIAWMNNQAFVSANYFAPSMVPSPTLYKLDRVRHQLDAVATTEKTDLISIDCNTRREELLMAGYDLVWQEPRVYSWKNGSLDTVKIHPMTVFPTAIALRPQGQEEGLIGTGSPEPAGQGGGRLLHFTREQEVNQVLFEDPEQRIVCIEWRPRGDRAMIIGNRYARTFST